MVKSRSRSTERPDKDQYFEIFLIIIFNFWTLNQEVVWRIRVEQWNKTKLCSVWSNWKFRTEKWNCCKFYLFRQSLGCSLSTKMSFLFQSVWVLFFFKRVLTAKGKPVPNKFQNKKHFSAKYLWCYWLDHRKTYSNRFAVVFYIYSVSFILVWDNFVFCARITEIISPV